MRSGSKLTLLAAGVAAAFVLTVQTNSEAWAEERPNAAPAPAEQPVSPPPKAGCPYRGGKLELIT
jgi:hypothetical protein